jgi:polygalacturonase
VLEVTRFGAVGDGKKPCTEALQKAIDACGAAGGGTVLFPPGRYLSGALFLRSHVNIHLSAGARLVASQRPGDFPPVKGRDEGVERQVHASQLTGVDLEGVSITGQGVLDGQGDPWWSAHDATWKIRLDAKLPREAPNPPAAPLQWPRPRSINLIRCRGVTIDGVTVEDTPFYSVHLVYCQDVTVTGLVTRSPRHQHDSAIVVDSCQRVLITSCLLSHCGEAVGLKSGYNEDGRRVGIACEDVVVSSCHMFSNGMSGVAIGSETAGGIRNVVVSGCVIRGGRQGVYIRSPRGRGGVVEHVRISDLVLDDIGEVGLKVSHYFDSVRLDVMRGGSARRDLEISRSRKAPVDDGTPTFRDFVFSGVSVGRVGQVGLVEGLPERYVRRITFQDIGVTEAGGGISCSMAAEVSVSGFTVGTLQAPAIDARETERLEIHRLRCATPPATVPLVWLENVTGALVHGCDVGQGGPAYEWLRQDGSRDVSVADNKAPPAKTGPSAGG